MRVRQKVGARGQAGDASAGDERRASAREVSMIKYQLKCGSDHPFEGWFRSSKAYDTQSRRKLVTCPVCGTAETECNSGSAVLFGIQTSGNSRS